jgi:uncharacterized protein
MNKKAMEFLACPSCKRELHLEVDEQRGNDVIAGSLLCKSCDHTYSIELGVPRLIVFDNDRSRQEDAVVSGREP